MKKKNVMFVVDERQMGGVSVLLSDILWNINIKQYNIDVLVLHDRGDYLKTLPKEINIIYGTKFFDTVDLSIKEAIKTKKIGIIYRKIRLIFLMKTKLIGKRIVKERNKMFTKTYDVEVAFKDGFPAIFTAYGNSIKKYHWLHTDYAMYDCTANYRPLFKVVFSKFDKIIGISKSVLMRFCEKYDVGRTDVILNIIDKNKIISKSKLEKIKYDNNKLNLVSVGRFHNMKGYDRLISVLHSLDIDGKLDNVVVRLIGGGPDDELIKNMINEYNLTDKVILLGRRENPFPYVVSSDCFLMCSRYEPFGLVILEALILGIPVLSTKVASIDEIMTSDYGMIVDNSSDGLYKGLLKIISDKSLLDKYKKNLKKYNYDVASILKQIEGLLNE